MATKKKVKKAVKKKTSAKKKKTSSKPNAKKPTLLCPICKSPHIHVDSQALGMEYSCLRCGYHGPSIVETNLKEAKRVVTQRRDEIQRYHRTRKNVRVKSFHGFLDRADTRLWLGMFSLAIVVLGAIMMSSKEGLYGLLFVAIGAVGSLIAEKA